MKAPSVLKLAIMQRGHSQRSFATSIGMREDRLSEIVNGAVVARDDELTKISEGLSACTIPFSADPSLLKTRSGDQPLPVASDSPHMQDLVCADMQARKALGVSRYGTALQANNGRDALRDLYEELLDASAYLRQLLYERDQK